MSQRVYKTLINDSEQPNNTTDIHTIVLVQFADVGLWIFWSLMHCSPKLLIKRIQRLTISHYQYISVIIIY